MRIYKGNKYNLPIIYKRCVEPAPGEITSLIINFYTDDELNCVQYNMAMEEIEIASPTKAIVFVKEHDLDYLEDGLIKYICEYSTDDDTYTFEGDTTFWLNTPSEYQPEPRYILPPATNETLGGVIIGEGIEVDSAGTISVTGVTGDWATQEDIDEAIAAETARTESTYLKSADMSDYPTKEEVAEDITAATADMATMTWVDDQHFLTQHQDLSDYYTKEEVDSEITGATQDMATETWVNDQGFLKEHQDLSDYAKTTAVTADINAAMAAETARTESTYLKEHQSLDNYYTKGEVDAEITAATNDMATETWVQNQGYLTQHQDISGKLNVSDFNTYSAATANDIAGKQATLVSGTNIKTINNESILGSGNITIQGGGDVVELTKAEYDELVSPDSGTTYIITDADMIDMDDYATQADLEELSATTLTALNGKADAENISADYGIPQWNSQGIISGKNSSVFTKTGYCNGNQFFYLDPLGYNAPSFYAPTSSGSQGQIVQADSNGYAAWSSYKIVFCSQSQYDALTTPDSSTVYIIVDPN